MADKKERTTSEKFELVITRFTSLIYSEMKKVTSNQVSTHLYQILNSVSTFNIDTFKKNQKDTLDLIEKYEKFATELSQTIVDNLRALPTGSKDYTKANDLKKSITEADKIVKKIKDFIESKSDISIAGKKIALHDLIEVNKKEKRKKTIGTGALGLASALTGSALPMMIPEGIKNLKQGIKDFKGNTGKGKLKTLGALGLGGLSLLTGSSSLASGSLMGASKLKEDANSELEMKKRSDELKKAYESNSKRSAFRNRGELDFLSGSSGGGSSGGGGSTASNVDATTIFDALKSIGLLDTSKRKDIKSRYGFAKGGLVDIRGKKNSRLGGATVNEQGPEQAIILPAKSNNPLEEQVKKLTETNKLLQELVGTNKKQLEEQEDASRLADLKHKENKKEGKKDTADVAKSDKKDKEAKKAEPASLLKEKLISRLASPKMLGGLAGGAVGGYAGYKAGGWLANKAEENGLVEEGGMGSKAIKYGTTAVGAVGGAVAGSKLASKIPGLKGIAGIAGAAMSEGTPVYVTNASEIGGSGGLGGIGNIAKGAMSSSLAAPLAIGAVGALATAGAFTGLMFLTKKVLDDTGINARIEKEGAERAKKQQAENDESGVTQSRKDSSEYFDKHPDETKDIYASYNRNEKTGEVEKKESSIKDDLKQLFTKEYWGFGKGENKAVQISAPALSTGGSFKTNGAKLILVGEDGEETVSVIPSATKNDVNPLTSQGNDEQTSFKPDPSDKNFPTGALSNPMYVILDDRKKKQSQSDIESAKLQDTTFTKMQDYFSKEEESYAKSSGFNREESSAKADEDTGILSKISNIFGNKSTSTAQPTGGASVGGKGGGSSFDLSKLKDGVGSVAAKYESGSKGVGTISTGKGDAGGKSYGTHQLSSKSGTLGTFLKSSGYDKQFSGMQQGSPEFDAKWKDLAANDQNFGKAQNDFISKTHAAPQLAKLEALGIDTKSKAIQEMAFSTGVQYGPNSNVIAQAIQASGKDPKTLKPSEIINIVQDFKASNVGTNFKSSSQNVQQSVATRHGKYEKADLLKIAQSEEQGGSVASAPTAKGTVASAPKEGNVANIKNNSISTSQSSVGGRLKNAETATDANMSTAMVRGTENAINNITTIGGSSPPPMPTPIIMTGDMSSFATRLAKSY